MLTSINQCAVWRRVSARIPIVALVIAFLLPGLPAMAASKAEQLVEDARQVFSGFTFEAEQELFHETVKKAKAVLIIPNLYEGAMGVGMSGGDGVFLMRKKNSDEWSEPAFYDVGSLSLGIKVGVQASDAIVLVMTEKGVKSFFKPEFELDGKDIKVTVLGGGGISTAPAGDLVSISRSKGALIGASLGKAKITQDLDKNEKYYGKPVSAKEIALRGKVSNPKSGPLRLTLRDMAK